MLIDTVLKPITTFIIYFLIINKNDEYAYFNKILY